MNKTNLKTKPNNYVFTIIVFFLLTNFIYNDFGIRFIIGYIALVCVSLVFLVAKGTISMDAIYGKKMLLLIFPCFLFAVMPNSNKSDLTISLTISMLIFGALILVCKTDKFEIGRCLKMIEIAAIVFSFYIIAVRVYPTFYSKYILPRFCQLAQQSCSELIKQGYGVPIGCSTTYADYLISIPLFYIISRVFFRYGKKKCNRGDALKILLFLLAFLLENRKGEMLTLIATLSFIFLLSMDKRKRNDFLKKIFGFSIVCVFLIVSLSILLKLGVLERYEAIIKKFVFGEAVSEDVSGGRLALWGQAWASFKQHPVLGIGWEQFMTQNTYQHEVHNTYLQLLCETGIVGFCLIVIPVLSMFFASLKNVLYIKKMEWTDESFFGYGLVGLGMQMFYIIINIIDPAFYHLNFFCFLGIAIILSSYSAKMCQTKRRAMTNEQN